MLPHACRFVPTCSEYAHGSGRAPRRDCADAWLALARDYCAVIPSARAGYDPVPAESSSGRIATVLRHVRCGTAPELNGLTELERHLARISQSPTRARRRGRPPNAAGVRRDLRADHPRRSSFCSRKADPPATEGGSHRDHAKPPRPGRQRCRPGCQPTSKAPAKQRAMRPRAAVTSQVRELRSRDRRREQTSTASSSPIAAHRRSRGS